MAIRTGINGFLMHPMALEGYKLSKKERFQMVETVISETNNKVAVFSGTGETDLNRNLDLLNDYKELDCEVVFFPIRFENSQQFRKHFIEMTNL